MMNRVKVRLLEIARRKERLIARAESQRLAIAGSCRPLQGPIAIVDRGVMLTRYLRGHPLLVAALVAAVVIVRRRGLLSLASRALSVWRIWRTLSAWPI